MESAITRAAAPPVWPRGLKVSRTLGVVAIARLCPFAGGGERRVVSARRDVQSKLATKFARARVKSKLTQEQLAKSTGLSLATIFRYETGRASDPRLRILVRVAIAA